MLYSNVRSIPNYSAKLQEFLRQNETHSKHRRIVKKKFPRRRIIVHHSSQIFMADLIEYTNPGFKHANRGYVYILLVIDCFSKMVYVEPIKHKDKFSAAKAFQIILGKLEHLPNTLITDRGLEFYNKNVREVLDTFGIHHYSIKTKMKASIAERAIRTLKEKLERYFHQNNTKNWINVIHKFVENYNATPHRSIGMAPKDVSESNTKKVFKKLFPDIELEAKPRLAVGDVVRVIKEKTLFDKGYKQNWSDNCYKVKIVQNKAGRIWYVIETLDGVKIPGIKYYWQLNLVAKKHDSQHSPGK